MKSNKVVQLTKEKHKQLKDELAEMKSIGRKLLADKLNQYRTDSNSEDGVAFNDVVAEKEALEARIVELDEMLENVVISNAQSCVCDVARLGCKVLVEIGDKKMEFHIVSSIESDPAKGKISEESPLGSALLGKKKGDKVRVKTPSSSTEYKILNIGTSS